MINSSSLVTFKTHDNNISVAQTPFLPGDIGNTFFPTGTGILEY
ncbi:hypothetical protein DJ66_0661 [Candidatus Liberibacter solanacearum]|uniref:Uncharacterized protein n=1 Tax=Candidatus Liberibacter solanacearum TaxID=556287 RepID=A0A0F4VKC1_9HYPH|nr:hypothetical protein [Candidatus Liberibacter solanacearum]KJZ81931.1 hypothetical protein DJ66_0661 [Candidatus Liberibacter solanacearum]